MQEFIDTIFNHDENLVEIKKEFLALLNRTINSKFSEAVRLDFTNIDKHISKFSKILISLLLHEPKVTLSLPYSLRKSNSKNDKIENVKFDQKQHYCIDGFANQEKQCVVVLPSPMMNGYPFMGIKTTVLIVEDRGVKKETKPPKSTIDKNIVEVGKTGGFADQPIKDMIIDVNKISTHQSLRNHTSINSYRRLSELASFDRTPVRNVRNNLEYRSKDDSDRKFQWKTYVEKFPENDFQNDFWRDKSFAATRNYNYNQRDSRRNLSLNRSSFRRPYLGVRDSVTKTSSKVNLITQKNLEAEKPFFHVEQKRLFERGNQGAKLHYQTILERNNKNRPSLVPSSMTNTSS